MKLEYEASDEQLKSLVERSTECEQSISIDCVNSPLKVLDVEKAWWTDLNGKLRLIKTISIFSLLLWQVLGSILLIPLFNFF